MALPLKANSAGKKILATELYRRFHAMKTYGKEPESLENIVAVFASDLEDYSIDKIMKAIRLHSQRSQEFPTVFDIVNLIKRNGKPPLSESMYVTISKKDYENRTEEEKRYMRDYEEEMREGWSEKPDPIMQSLRSGENERLRAEVNNLREENKRLSNLLHDARMSNGLEKSTPTHRDKIDKTLQYLKENGASEQEINEFIASQMKPKSLTHIAA